MRELSSDEVAYAVDNPKFKTVVEAQLSSNVLHVKLKGCSRISKTMFTYAIQKGGHRCGNEKYYFHDLVLWQNMEKALTAIWKNCGRWQYS